MPLIILKRQCSLPCDPTEMVGGKNRANQPSGFRWSPRNEASAAEAISECDASTVPFQPSVQSQVATSAELNTTYGKQEYHARLIAGDRDLRGNEDVDDEACSPSIGAAQSSKRWYRSTLLRTSSGLRPEGMVEVFRVLDP